MLEHGGRIGTREYQCTLGDRANLYFGNLENHVILHLKLGRETVRVLVERDWGWLFGFRCLARGQASTERGSVLVAHGVDAHFPGIMQATRHAGIILNLIVAVLRRSHAKVRV